ncbi:MAG: 50S ribosomal protein L21 [candidate division KSB1 bacterium]|jgi:large subunit ribosomal protein L21|nr:50S ribosomal protein L21 [candidate division KSB1 bacterium]
MYAVVEIAGQQFKVEKGDNILAPKLVGKAGEKVEFDRVFLTSESEDVNVGAPLVKGATVKATILEHERGDKVTIFKMKRRKGYRLKKGHRQDYTRLQIDDIVVSGGKKNGS